MSDLCQKELVDCTCCPAIISHMWRKALPSNVQAGIAHMSFDSANFEAIIKLADDIFATNAHAASASVPTVAAIQQNPDETLPAIPYPQPEVAAIQRGGGRGRGRGGRGRGRGNRGSSNGGGGGQSSSTASGQRHSGAKHPDLPSGEWTGCQMHFKHGKSAFFCSEPGTCPWKNIFLPRPSK